MKTIITNDSVSMCFNLLLSLPSPGDVPESLARNVDHGSFRGIASPHDVIVFIKKHVCDATLSQEPLLVLSHARAERFSLIPDEKLLKSI